MNNRNPKYDNDLVTLGYLKQYMQENGVEALDNLIKELPKSYSTPPSTPYYVGSILYYDHAVYRCKSDRLQGTFNWSDWDLVATDDQDLNYWIENTYQTDKLQFQEQIDGKVETYYQATDPNTWTTDLEKAHHVGDYWYNTTTNTQWRFSKLNTNPITYGWQQVNIPTSVYDLIDTKKSIYTSKPTSYKKDDLWIIEDTISDSDLPVGTVENPIAKGDWVFATQNSDTYNKNHWIKKDENVSMEYLEDHYYTTTEVETKVDELEKYTDTEITKAKNEINLNVSQNYTTLTTFNQKVLDYDEHIGDIEDTVLNNTDLIANLNLGVDRITSTVATNTEKLSDIDDDLQSYKETLSTQITQTNNEVLLQFNSVNELIKQMTNVESAHYEQLQQYIRFIGGIIQLGQLNSELTAELSNTELAFKQNGTKVAYISNNKMYITDAEVANSLTIYNFGYTKESNGSLSFGKVK